MKVNPTSMGWQDLKDLFFRRDAMPPPPTLLSVPYSAQLLRERAQLHDNNLQRTQAARDLRGGAKQTPTAVENKIL